MKYDHSKIEKKWRDVWAKSKIYTTPDSVPGKDNFYLLVEFPYPSGNLHVGHWYAFAVPDILARKKRMDGKNVLYPIGFDAFGLPAENAAIKNGVNPRQWTENNIAYMKTQIESMGTTFDWSREVATIDPAYYKWTQWLFLQLYKKGLVYQRETAVNWCPTDKTVLANEQVVDGKCERCGAEVVQRQMLQWNIKITDYADRLIDDLAALDWPEQIKESQRNWIGRSEGALISFQLLAGSLQEEVEVFTTRPDTLFGATYLVLSPEHPLVGQICVSQTCTNNKEVVDYVKAASKKTELERQANKEKTGVQLKGVMAVNPATGEKIPMFIADYVLAHYGTGAIMAVPAHDERDFEFAKKFSLPIKDVIAPLVIRSSGQDAFRNEEPVVERTAAMAVVKHWQDDKYLCLNWAWNDIHGFVTGGIEEGEDPVAAAKREIEEETGYSSAEFVRGLGSRTHVKFYAGNKKTNRFAHFTPLLFKLKDDARQPVAEEESKIHEAVWIDADKLNDYLNRDDFKLVWNRVLKEAAYTGPGILENSGDFDGMTVADAKKAMTEKYGRAKKTYKLRDWIVSRQRYWGVPIPIVHCGVCGTQAVPDTQLPVVLPDVEDYLPEGSGKSPLAKKKDFVQTMCPACNGVAERETDTLDTFVDSSWYFLRYTDPRNNTQFADSSKQKNWMPVDLYSGGAEHTTMHLLYSRFWHKALFDLGLVADSEPYKHRMNRSLILGPDGQKMSKSKGNVVDPDSVVAQLGADTVRMYLAFIGPYNEVSSSPWYPDGGVGIRRFLERVARTEEYVQEGDVEELDSILHKTVKKVGDDIEAMKFNTAISQLMIFLNAVEKEKKIGKRQWETVLKVLTPFAPHLAEELWHAVGNSDSIHLQTWPAFDASKLIEKEVTIAIQINGKTRGEVVLASDSDKDAVESAARQAMAEKLSGKTVVRIIVVLNRLVNFVVSE